MVLHQHLTNVLVKMDVYLNFVGFILHFLIIKTSCQISLPASSHEFYVTEIVRVKRQAGYVYNKPNIPFDLPSRPMNIPTQEPNIDRTHAQQMYYAYPVPAAGQSANTGYSSGSKVSSTASASNGGGYDYGSQRGSISGTQSSSSESSQNINSGITTSTGATGYNYGGATITTNAGQLTSLVSSQTINTGSSMTSSGSSSYQYGAPSSASGAGQAETQTGFMDNGAKTLTRQFSTDTSSAGYNYNVRVPIVDQTVDSYDSSSGGPTNTDVMSTVSNPSPTATSSVSSSYHYDTPSTGSSGSITGTTFTSSSESIQDSALSGFDKEVAVQPQTNFEQTSLNLGSTRTSLNSGSNQNLPGVTSIHYSYNPPSPSVSSTALASKISSSAHTSSSSGSTATSSVSTNYRYESPKGSVSNDDLSLTISTKAPDYLPPNAGASGSKLEAISVIRQPTDLNKPPSNSGVVNPFINKPSQSYIPPSFSTSLEPTVNSPSQTYVPSSNIGSAESFKGELSLSYGPPRGNVPSAPLVTQSYISPSISQQSGTQAAQLSNSYVPPTNAEKVVQQATYIPPSGDGSTRPSYRQPSQSYLTSSSSADATVQISSPSSGLNNNNIVAESNKNYLPPNNFSASVTSNVLVTGQSPNANYIPPSGLSNKQGTLFTPSATYLPPVV